jgi:thioredoxin reductase (NADPH)
VTLIHRRREFRASRIMDARVRSNPSIRLVLDSVVEEVMDPAAGKVTGVRVRNVVTGAASDIAVDGLFLAIGHVPNTEAFKGRLELDGQGFIVARNTKTSVPGVFAAGDVQDPRYKQAVTAAGSGCMAALEVERFMAEHAR